MRRWIAVFAMFAAVGVGAATQPAERLGNNMTSRQAAAAWAADAHLIVESEHQFANTGNYTVFYFRNASGCQLALVPLGRAEEILPTLRASIDERKWQESRLLLGKLEPMPKTAFDVHVRRLLARFTLGHAPQAAMLIAPPACLSESFLNSLPEWPAP